MLRVILVTFLLTSVVKSKQLPSFVKICQINDPQLSGCVKNSIEVLQSRLKTGIANFRTPNLNPLIIPRIRVQHDIFDENITNIHVYNLHNFKIVDIQVDPVQLTVNAKLNFRYVTFLANYSARGQFVVLQLNGSGNVILDFDDTDIEMDLRLKMVKINNKTHLDVKGMKINIMPNVLNAYADNLINGNPELSKSALALIDENIFEFYALVAPTFNEVAEEFATSIFKYVFNKWTFEELFPK